MRKLLLIFCWQGDEERVERHESHWQKSGCDLLYCFPHDQPLRNRPGLCCHLSEQYGRSMLRRHLDALAFAHRAGYDHIYCTEADSVCFSAAPTPPYTTIGGYVFNDPDNPRFRAKTFVHWFWSFNARVLNAFLSANPEQDDAFAELFPDRWLAFASERTGVPVSHDERVFSRNQFNTSELMVEARSAKERGVWAMHGVKTEQQLREMMA